MSTPAEQFVNSQELLAIQTRINDLRRQEAQYANDTSAAGQQILQATRNQLTVERNRHAQQRAGLVDLESYNKEFSSFAKSYVKLSSVVKNQLQTQSSVNSSLSVYKALAEDIAKSKAREGQLSGDQLELEQERGALMTEINTSFLTQAKATAKAIDDAKGLTEFDKMRRELKETQLELSDEERKKLEEAINQTEILYKKEQRIKSIQESQKGLYDAMPESLRSGVDFAQKLGDTLKTAGKGAVVFMLLAAVVTAAVASFTALDAAAKDFRTETGLTNSQMEGIKSDANEIVGEFANLGVEAKNVFDTVSALKSEFSDTVDFSKETVAALTVMNTNFGVAAEDAAKVQGIMEQVGGLSSETAASVGMQVVQLAKAAKVAPAKVMKDIAENAEAASIFFKGNVELLAKQAVEARRLGTNLTEVTKTAERLLDFEGSIEDELVAATFVGGQFNLSQARALAIQGDLVGAQKETLRQIQRSGDFRKQDYHTQLQLAKASGLSVAEINKQLDTQDKLSKLKKEDREAAEKAIEQGLDITNINADQLAQETEKFAAQQEMQGQVDKLSNAFQGIAATIGSSLTPLLEGLIPIVSFLLLPVQAIATGFSLIVGYLKENIPLLVTLGTLAGAYYAKSIAGAVANIWSKIVGTLGPFGIPVAIAATIGAVAMAKNAMSSAQVGDMSSPADGKTVVSTKEGGLFELSPNDDLVAAPGAAAALANANKTQSLNVQSIGSPTETLNGSNTLLEPMTSLVSELKALRENISNGGDVVDKIADNTGGISVGTGVGLQSDKNKSMETATESGVNTNTENLTKSQGDISTLSAPLQAMINELKALRFDMASGKIGVYMDTTKVTSKIAKQVDQSTRNNYTVGQA
jgi:hypothetical protein